MPFSNLNRTAVVLVLVGVLIGAGGILVANAALEYTNTESFCLSCHEMRENAYAEYQETIHDYNRTGKRATCPDCHVPKEFVPKIWRKIKATKELVYHVAGKLDTPEKYEEHRYEMALNVWREMKANDSKACRNCHDVTRMNPDKQTAETLDRHKKGEAEGKTCIDCHFAIAHNEPEGELAPEDL